LIIEFWHNGRQEAECPADEVFDLPADAQESFWHVQDMLDRAIKLRMEGPHETE
jgi:hypothetical protein